MDTQPYSNIKILTDEQLKALPTPRLLGVLRSVHKHCRETTIYSNPDPRELTKGTDEWQSYHRRIKEILKTREHVK